MSAFAGRNIFASSQDFPVSRKRFFVSPSTLPAWKIFPWETAVGRAAVFRKGCGLTVEQEIVCLSEIRSEGGDPVGVGHGHGFLGADLADGRGPEGNADLDGD